MRPFNNIKVVFQKLPNNNNYQVGPYPGEHKTFVQHLYNVDPTSSTLDQHCLNFIQMFCVYWDMSFPWKDASTIYKTYTL